jgi:hypothetical protein
MVASLRQYRWHHSQSTLLDGRVLVCGGFAVDATSGPFVLSCTEIYTPETNTWRSGPNLLQQYRDHSSVQSTLNDGRVLVSGGYGTFSPCRETSAEIYDPTTDTFTRSTHMLRTRKRESSDHTQSTLLDGRVLVCGTGTAEIYDPQTEVWSVASSMLQHRDKASQSTLLDGRVLVCGGTTPWYDCETSASPRTLSFSTTEMYDPLTDTWSPAPPMLSARSGHSQSTLSDGRVLVCGGGNKDTRRCGTTEIFNPFTDTWSHAPPMLCSRTHHSQSTLRDGRILVCDGFLGDCDDFFSSAEIFDDRLWSLKHHHQFHPHARQWVRTLFLCNLRWGRRCQANRDSQSESESTTSIPPLPIEIWLQVLGMIHHHQMLA